jgi:hypothetical protein
VIEDTDSQNSSLDPFQKGCSEKQIELLVWRLMSSGLFWEELGLREIRGYFLWVRIRKSKLTTPFWSRRATIEMLRVMLYSA